MSKCDDSFVETVLGESVFAAKRALDPLSSPNDIHGRETRERHSATILDGVYEGNLPLMVAVHGLLGTGKTPMGVSGIHPRTDDLAVQYVNLKECRSIFSAANEIHLELTGEKGGAYEGLDGAFAGLWETLAAYPGERCSSSRRLIISNRTRIMIPRSSSIGCGVVRETRPRDQPSAWLLSDELLAVEWGGAPRSRGLVDRIRRLRLPATPTLFLVSYI